MKLFFRNHSLRHGCQRRCIPHSQPRGAGHGWNAHHGKHALHRGGAGLSAWIRRRPQLRPARVNGCHNAAAGKIFTPEKNALS